MKKVTIRIRPDSQAALKEMGERFIEAWKSGQADTDLLEFESTAALFRVLTRKRWELIQRLQVSGPNTVRGLARDLGRDVKRVHEDVSALMPYGLVARTSEGKFEVPYDVIHADFDLSAHEARDDFHTSQYIKAVNVPAVLEPLLVEADSGSKPLDVIELGGRLQAALADSAVDTEELRRGAFAEIAALHFQPSRGDRRSWGIYWSELSSATTVDGTQIRFPDVAQVDDGILAHWIRRSESSKHPVLRARFADLVWEIGRYLKDRAKRQPESQTAIVSIDVPVSLAQRAIDAYLDAVAHALFEDEYHAWQFLDRAIELACSIRDDARKTVAKAALFSFYGSIQEKNEKFMWWRFDDIAWEHSKWLAFTDQEQALIIRALERALSCHSNKQDEKSFDPHQAMNAADRLGRRYSQMRDPARAKQALKIAASAFEEAAKKAGALVAAAWLEDLILRYRNAGMVEDAARVERSIRNRMNEAQSELKRIEVPLNIPKEELDKWADQIAGASIEEALGRIAANFLIKEDSTRKSVEEMLEKAPLMARIPHAIIGSSGLTAAKVGSIEEDVDGRTIAHAANLFNWQAPWLYFAINRVKEKHGIELENLVSFISAAPWFPVTREPFLREGLAAWLSDDSVKAIHVLVPQVEAALRDILIGMGAPAVNYDHRSGGFEVLGMGAILGHDAFRVAFPKDCRFHLRVLYTDQRGINIRNQLAHGLADVELLRMGLANWVVHSLLMISGLRVREKKSN